MAAPFAAPCAAQPVNSATVTGASEIAAAQSPVQLAQSHHRFYRDQYGRYYIRERSGHIRPYDEAPYGGWRGRAERYGWSYGGRPSHERRRSRDDRSYAQPQPRERRHEETHEERRTAVRTWRRRWKQGWEGGESPPPANAHRIQTSRYGNYRTMCVRLCDGYYFPVSYRTSRSRLDNDAAYCHSRCGATATKLFVMRTGADVDTMADLGGHPYSGLPNAFRYRKELVNQCRCKPDPWSPSELARHQAYADGESENADAGTAAQTTADAGVTAAR